MGFMRPITGTGLTVSALGLGTVKFGRNEGVKYPAAFAIPDDAAVATLLGQAAELGINLIDSAPAYGNSEERLGRLLPNRHDWVIATKVGEEFSNGVSTFDFSAAHTRASIERSLERLRTDYLDIALIHSDGNDMDILRHTDCVESLQACQREGLVRAIGMSSKTLEGGILAASLLDIVMITWNTEQRDTAVLDYAREHGKGVLVKKGLLSGHAGSVADSLRLVLSTVGVSAMIVGTINPAHLAENVRLARTLTG